MLSTVCRSFYLPRELTVVIVTAVYIPPDANVSAALSQLYATVSKHQQAHPDGVHIIAGDFNQACLKTVLPKFTQYVKCATRGNNTLDHVYSNLKHAYRATPLPHLGQSDHLSLLLIPASTPLRRKTKPYIKTIKSGPRELSLNCRTALNIQCGTCSNNRTWRNIQELYCPTSIIVQTL